MEIWRAIHGYEYLYEISSLGNVRSLDRFKNHNTSKQGKIMIKGVNLRPYLNTKGYLKVELSSGKRESRKTFSVHRLVALAFIPNPNNYPQVNHKDGDKTNNSVSNLEWCTNSMNQLHAWRTGLQKSTKSSGKPMRPVVKADKYTEEPIETYESIALAAKCNSIAKASNISMVCQNKRKSAGGFHWKYLHEGDDAYES